MNSNRKIALTVGILFIIATVAGILSAVFYNNIINDTDYLINISVNSTTLIIVALLELIMIAAIVAIPVFLFSTLKKHNEKIAFGYFGARIIEAATLIIGTITLLSLLTLSREFASAGAIDVSYFQTLGTLILAVGDWALLIGGQIVFSLTALILNYSLYQSKLIPRWLSVWGIIGVPLMLASGILGISVGTFSTIVTLLVIPLALQEMVFAVWLIVKGFNSSAITSPSTKTVY